MGGSVKCKSTSPRAEREGEREREREREREKGGERERIRNIRNTEILFNKAIAHLKGCKHNKPCNAMHTQYSIC